MDRQLSRKGNSKNLILNSSFHVLMLKTKVCGMKNYRTAALESNVRVTE
jgi:hypothetical protein